jgi:probable HAF family extracellular repeat protein
VSLNPIRVIGTAPVTGTVSLNAAAPAGGFVVSLSSSAPAVAAVPASVTVPAGQSSATFLVEITPVQDQATVTISATTSGGPSSSATLTVVPIALVALGVNPTCVSVSGSSTGTVLLNGLAIPGGVTVSLVSSQPALASVPPSVTVPAGVDRATFSVQTTVVTSSAAVTISGTHRTVTKTGGLQLVPPFSIGTYTVTDLGSGRASGINIAGRVVGGDTRDPSAFMWQNGVMTRLGALPGDRSSMAWGIDQSGQVVGESGTLDHHAFIWANGTMRPLGTLPGGTNSIASAISRSRVVGSADVQLPAGTGFHAFVSGMQGGLIDLGTFRSDGLGQSSAQAINSSGQIVGNSSIDGPGDQHRSVLWDGYGAGARTIFGPTVVATAINDAGQVTGGFFTDFGPSHAFVWQNGTLIDLGTLASTGTGPLASNANGINASGQVVGTSFGPSGHAIIASLDRCMTDLNDAIPAGSGWELEAGIAINDNGQIVGQGTLGGAPRHIFLLTPDRSGGQCAELGHGSVDGAGCQCCRREPARLQHRARDVHRRAGRAQCDLLDPG